MRFSHAAMALAVGMGVGASFVSSAQADLNIYVGYLNNLSGAPDPEDIPTPFDPDATTTLVSSGDSTTPHDTGVLRFENDCPLDVTVDFAAVVLASFDGSAVTVTTLNLSSEWGLSRTVAPGENLVLAETVNFNFDTSDFGLFLDPVVILKIDGIQHVFVDTDRVLLGHEEIGNTPETTPYHLLGSVACIPEPASLAFLGLGLVSLVGRKPRRA